MKQSQQAHGRTREQVDAFLSQFFGAGNDVWPFLDPTYPWKDRTLPFVDALRRGVDAPIVLPYTDKGRDSFAMYVIARDSADAAKTAELITAFAGPTYITDERGVRPVRLDPNNPIERAVLDFAGPGVTFRLGTGKRLQYRTQLAETLQLMQQTVSRRPPRLWRVAKPLGRLLAEFDAALAAGGEASSKDVLEQLSATSGITASNLANLKVKRLDRLGRSRDVLALPGLLDVVRQDPPAPVKEAVLNAVYAVALEEPLTASDLQTAQDGLIVSGRFVPDLMHGDARSFMSQALTVLLLAAAMRNDLVSLERLVETVEESGKSAEIPPLVWGFTQQVLQGLPVTEDAVEQTPQLQNESETDAPSQVEVAPAESALLVDSWPSLLVTIADGRPEGSAALGSGLWASWPTPAHHDEDLAAFLDGLGNRAAERVWGAVGAFIDAIGYAAPAGRTAQAFIRNAVTFDRFSPGDLAALHALTEIALRAAPSKQAYTEILDEIGSERDRWIAPERAAIALDFVDRLVLAACPDSAARSNLAFALMDPLWRHQGRLDEADLAFARRLSRELDIDFVWNEPATDGGEPSSIAALPALNLLLYSLDEAVLARCQDELGRLAPAVTTAIAHDHVGSPQLRHKARNADVVVMATRSATHAATGFITKHAGTAQIGYADGSGSASLLRAAVAGLRLAAVQP